MSKASLMPLPKQQFLTNLGIPLVNGKVYTYAAGTTNPLATFTDPEATIQQTNPIVLNARGEPAQPIYWSGSYRVDVKDFLGNLVYSVDHYTDTMALVNAALDTLQLADYTALRAYRGDRQRIYITGYLAAAAPSGIAGDFIRDDTDVASADNGGTVIIDGNGKRWKRVFAGQVNVQWFGAKGNGVADDTAAIQAAVNTASAVVFPSGTYIISSKVTCVKFAQALSGQGNKYSDVLIKYTGAGTAIEFSNATNYNSMRRLTLIAVSAVPTNFYDTGTVGVNLVACNVDMEDVRVSGFEYLVQSNFDSYYNRFVNCRFDRFKVGLNKFSSNNLKVHDCRVQEFHSFALVTGGNGVFAITSSSFEVFNGNIVESTAPGQVVFKENYLEIYWNTAAPTNFPVNPLGYFTDAIFFIGSYRSLILRDNNLQMNGARRILNVNVCVHFESTGNTITDFDTTSGYSSFVDQLYSITVPADYIHIEDVMNAYYDHNIVVNPGRARTQSYLPISSPEKHFHYYDAILNTTFDAYFTAGSYPKAIHLVPINGWKNDDPAVNTLRLRYTDAGVILNGVVDGTAKTGIVVANLATPYMAKNSFNEIGRYFRWQAFNNYGDTPTELITFRYLYTNGDIRLETAPASLARIVFDNVLIPHL